jgi:signal transduction histidine kinase
VRRRVFTSAVLLTVVAVVLFGLPLALVVRDLYLNEATLRLEREATLALRHVPDDFVRRTDLVELPARTHTTFGLYDGNGDRVRGGGPARGDTAVQAALASNIVDSERGGRLVVGVPVAVDEQVEGVLRAEQPTSVIDSRLAATWAVMALLGLAAVAVAAMLGHHQAKRVTRPVEDLRDAAVELGHGNFAISAPTSGVPELDDAAAALAATADRLGAMVGRERAFSADASHQLRTPLTGLRLLVETELAAPREDPTALLTEALHEIDELEDTIDQLLRLARDAPDDRGRVDVGALFAGATERWRAQLAAAGRDLRVQGATVLHPPRASTTAVEQILDVLLDNALEHGGGAVTLSGRAVEGGLAIDVADEGVGIEGDPAEAFARRSRAAKGHGIGLALARSLAEAEGGRLVLRRATPAPVFELVLTGA